MFRHPKYYKELRKLRNKSDQAISLRARDGECERATGPGHKRQATSSQASSDKPQATSVKLQAASDKLTNLEPFIKFQATSIGGLD